MRCQSTSAGNLPHRLPRFADISIDDYGPAIEHGMAEQLAALTTITSSTEEPTLENTLVALDMIFLNNDKQSCTAGRATIHQVARFIS